MPYWRRFFMAGSVVLLLLPVMLLSGCKKENLAGKGFRFPLSAEPRQIDPQVSTDAASITLVAALFEGLARLDESGKAQPAAADWTVSDDGLTYTFTLFDSKWSDGSDVTAHDFVFGMQRAVLPSTKSALAQELFMIKNAHKVNSGKLAVSKLGVKALNDKQLTVTLAKPDIDFPAKTASTPFMPCKQSFFEETNGRYGLENEYILTNGPFFLKAWNHNQSLLLYKSEHYHDAENILPSAVRYVIGKIQDPVHLLSEGLLDAAPIPAEKVEQAKDAGIRLIPQKDTVRMLWFNNRNETLENASVRCALRDALEWDIIYAQLNTAIDVPAAGLVAPDSIASSHQKYRTDNNAITPVTRGAKAHAQLTDALEQIGLDKMPALTLLCADDEYNTNIARFIVQSWQKNLSLYFSIKSVSPSELAARVKVGNYQLALYSGSAPGPNAVDTLGSFVTGAVGNHARFSNKTFDKKFSSSNTAKRADLEALEAFLWQTCPSIPISFELRYTGIPEASSGIVVRSFGGGTFGAPYDFRKAGKK